MHPMQKLLISNRRQGKFEVLAKAGTDEATIYLYDMIVSSDDEAEWWGGVSPQSFVKALNEISAGTIHLRVNSPGGSVFAGRAIEQAIREHKSKIIVHVDGIAASAASFLIMAADEIIMAPGSFLMIHKAWTFSYGNADDLRKQAELLDQLDGSFVRTYAKRSGQGEEQLATWLAAETWFSDQDAVRQGFADRVAEEDAPKDQAVSWNLAAFEHAPSATIAPTARPKASKEAEKEPAPEPVDRDKLMRAALKAMIPA